MNILCIGGPYHHGLCRYRGPDPTILDDADRQILRLENRVRKLEEALRTILRDPVDAAHWAAKALEARP